MRLHRMAHIGAILLALLGGNGVLAATADADSSQDQLIDLPGGAIHVVTSGVPDSHAVVLIHGLGASTSWWDPVMPALDGKYIVRVDLLGHGKSAKPESGYSIREQAARVGTILDHLGVTRATVIGHSSGGYVATSLAEQRRPLVSALGLIDSGPRLDAFTDNGPVGELLLNPAIGQPLWPLLPDAAIRMAMSSAFTRDVQIPDQWVSDLHGMTYRSVTATSAASDDYLTQRTEPARLTDLAIPTMVIYGTRDRRWQPSSFDDYRQIPSARIEPLDCGHTPMAEDPDHTGPLLRDFVDAH
ncbi:alpha/beta fold hydrolase [Nocardia sp. CDC160]|uniref:alpha/beta fold hydrolase n=1 Tax=Nocardia sp. CDC160 TaxID=3112166 RepID=UPI002DB9DF23|nr:alpha/beta hydrolase [Nocardia sp. CDC160]MEC3917653.1 alpha/beta hydrolase [Nocardia sp. CDC160]